MIGWLLCLALAVLVLYGCKRHGAIVTQLRATETVAACQATVIAEQSSLIRSLRTANAEKEIAIRQIADAFQEHVVPVQKCKLSTGEWTH